jgi:hypothetical protein
MQIYLQVNDETQKNFIGVTPNMGTEENYKNYPQDKFILLNRTTYNMCSLDLAENMYQGAFEIKEFYHMSDENGIYYLRKYYTEDFTDDDLKFFNNSIDNNTLFLSKDFYVEFNKSETELYNYLLDKLNDKLLKQLKIVKKRHNFRNILKYCQDQSISLRETSQNISQLSPVDLYHLIDVNSITQSLEKSLHVFDYESDSSSENNDVSFGDLSSIHNSLPSNKIDLPDVDLFDIQHEDKEVLINELLEKRNSLLTGEIQPYQLKIYLEYLGVPFRKNSNKSTLIKILDEFITGHNKK